MLGVSVEPRETAMIVPALPHAPPESVGLIPERLKRLTAAMARQIEEKKAPGLAMLIARNGKIAYRQTIGTLKPSGPPMSEDAIFRIYSMTKPIVSVATIMLVEEGRLLLSEPVAKYLPAFASMTVGVERSGKFERVPTARPITILDLMRHTSGFTYGFLGTSRIHRLTHEAYILSQNRSMDEHLADLARIPLLRQPGDVWEYGHSTDVLGRVVEIVSGMSLGRLLETRVFQPLGMVDTAFYTPPAKLGRRAEAFPSGLNERDHVDRVDSTEPPQCEFGGTGLVSTMDDYARFCAMLIGGGALGGERLLSSRAFASMTTDQLGGAIIGRSPILEPGHGFGLGFAVRLGLRGAAFGGAGEFRWGGWAGTGFWVSPSDQMFAIFMVQAPEYIYYLREIFRNLAYAALD
jgi:CubicO group peptidase (beta-lactamase class C family)